MENIIAIGTGLVVGVGILTLVWRILVGDREIKRLDEALSQFVRTEETGKKGGKGKGRKKG